MKPKLNIVEAPSATNKRKGASHASESVQGYFEALAEVPWQWAEFSRHPSSGAASSRVAQLRKAKLYSKYPVEWATKTTGRKMDKDRTETMVIVRWVGTVDHTALPEFAGGPAISPDAEYVTGAYAFDGTDFWRFSSLDPNHAMHFWAKTIELEVEPGIVQPRAKALWHMPAKRQELAQLRLVFSPVELVDEPGGFD